MQAKQKKPETQEISLTAIQKGQFEACLLGTTPIILEAMSTKTMQTLVLPSPKKGAAAKQSTLKHNPIEEYRSSIYRDISDDGPTVIQFMASAVKHAMASIPLDIPDTGTSKAQLERLLCAPQDKIALYGVPQMLMSTVRCSDMNRTPDVRTRAIIKNWACKILISYVRPVLQQPMVERLLASAGFMRGIGGWRQGKGNGSFGLFEVVDSDDPRFVSILKTGGRKTQLAALEAPDFYDNETAKLYTWVLEELAKRSQHMDTAHVASAPISKKNGKGKAKLSLIEQPTID